MLATKSPVWKIWVLLLRVCEAATQGASSDPRSLAAAVQNINGASSIISLLPVLSGKTQNVKAVAARTFPGSLAILGVGAGRVLSKLQVGLMLLSADLYRNVVSDLAAYHQEFVNTFSPSFVHVPTGTPERHASNVVVNHNLTEDYMVEAWFQTQGLPAKVELSQRNNRRVFGGLLVYVLVYALETFLGVQNAATGTTIPLIVLQATSGLLWILAVCLLQAARGQGQRFIYLNRLATADYRCFQLVASGKHVQSVVLSTQLSNIREYNLFDSKYESKRLKVVGAAMVLSGIIDVFTTFLLVGLNGWAYGWLGLQVIIIAIKVVFSLEPIRRVPIVAVQALVGNMAEKPPPVLASPAPDQPRKTRLPIVVNAAPEYSFREICVHQNVVLEHATQLCWHSRTPGLFIGQPYFVQRPSVPEKQTVSPTSSMPTLAPVRVASLRGKHAVPSEPEKAFISPVSSPTSPPSAYRCPSPPSSESSRSTRSTVLPAARTSNEIEIAELPRIVVSTASPVAAPPQADQSAPPVSPPISPPISPSPISPNAPATPPGIPLARSISSRTSIASRAPTPPAKSPARRAATLPPRPSPRAGTPVRRDPSLRAAPPHPPQPPRPEGPPPPTPSTSVPGVPIIAAPRPRREPSMPLSPPPEPEPEPVRYLALKDGKLTLSESEQPKEAKEALQREFLACLAEVVRANKVPSAEFLQAVETTLGGIRRTMSDTWYLFGTTDLLRYVRTSHQDLWWRKYV